MGSGSGGASGTSLAALGFNVAGDLLKGYGQEQTDKYNAAILEEQAQFGNVKAAEAGAQLSQRLNQTLGNIDTIRAGRPHRRHFADGRGGARAGRADRHHATLNHSRQRPDAIGIGEPTGAVAQVRRQPGGDGRLPAGWGPGAWLRQPGRVLAAVPGVQPQHPRRDGLGHGRNTRPTRPRRSAR